MALNFLDSLKKHFTPEGKRTQLIEASRVGEKLEAFVESGQFQILIDLILDPMEKEAFEAYQKLDPQDFSAVAQNQKIGQVIKEIKRRVAVKIREGYNARQNLESENKESEE